MVKYRLISIYIHNILLDFKVHGTINHIVSIGSGLILLIWPIWPIFMAHIDDIDIETH